MQQWGCIFLNAKTASAVLHLRTLFIRLTVLPVRAGWYRAAEP